MMKMIGTTAGICSYLKNRGIINRPDASRLHAVAALALGLAPVGFLTVRSWTNGALLVLTVIAIYHLSRNWRSYRALFGNPRVAWLVAAMISPFLAIAFSQLLRWQLSPPAFDAPARFLVGAAVFLFLIRCRIDVVRLLRWAAPLSVLLLAVSLAVDHRATITWGRLSTYFVDPLTLGQYSLLLGFFSLLTIGIGKKKSRIFDAFNICAAAVGFAISIASQSRSGWAAMPALYVIWLITMVQAHSLRKALHISLVSFALVVAASLLLYQYSDAVHARIDQFHHDLLDYLRGGERDTSTGVRLSMLRAAWDLFLANPIHGYGDGQVPPLDSIPAIGPYYTLALDVALREHGAHNELAQNVLRSGLFGLVSTILIFAVPFVLFARNLTCTDPRTAGAAAIGLAYTSATFIFGLSTETFSLKYLATFYAVMIASTAAQVIWTQDSPAAARPITP